MNNEADKIEIRSDEVNEILTTPPRWLVRSGIGLLTLIVGAMIGLSFIIEYPDVVPARVKLVNSNPSVAVIARESGTLDALRVVEKQEVTQGDLLAVIENPCKYDDLLILEKEIERLDPLKSYRIKKYRPKNNLQIGSIGKSYAELVREIKNLQYDLNKDFKYKNIEHLKRQVKTQLDFNSEQEKLKRAMNKEINLTKENIQVKERLLESGNIAADVVNELREKLLTQERKQQELNLNIINSNVKIEELNKQITLIEQGDAEDKDTQFSAVQESVNSIRAEIEDWKSKYLIFAPVNGLATFNENWTSRQYVAAGQKIMDIVPPDGSIRAEALLHQSGSGKVAQEQVANIKLDPYPFREFGMLKGKVSSLTLIPENDYYKLKIDVKNPVSTYDKEMILKQGMEGRVEIITEKRKLFWRILDNFYDLLKNR